MLDANQRSALAIIRSLGRHGLEVVAGDHARNSLGGASRYAATSVRYSDPAVSPRRFLDEITDIVNRLAIDVIMPATDLTTMLLVSQSDFRKNVHLATTSRASYEALTDKARLFELADRLAVRIPQTRTVHSREALRDVADEFGFPVVLKPARSRYLKGGQIISSRVEIARSRTELDAIIQSMTWFEDIPCLVQRFIDGHGAGVFALYGALGPIAWFAHRRLREKPPTGGVSVLCESAAIDPAMQSAAATLLSAVGWTGVAMVEFRVSSDGTPHLMEVNGRFWGSLQLAIDCGVDFPWLLYQHAQGLPVTGPPDYAVGSRLRWLLGDLDSLLIELKQRSLGSDRKAHAVGAFLGSFTDMHCQQEILRLHDPRPGILELRQWLRQLWRKD